MTRKGSSEASDVYKKPAFNREEAAISRDFNSTEAQRARAFNANEAEVNRNFQAEMSNSQYQRATSDLKLAGLNPMLAYTNGGAGNISGATAAGAQASGGAASSGPMIPMGNSARAGIDGAMAAAQIANVQSQTKVNEATKEKIAAEVPKVKQETTNLQAGLHNIKAELDKIVANKDLLIKQGYTETERYNLLNAQKEVAKIEVQLKATQITQTEAQTKLTKVMERLQKLEIPGKQNEADFEKAMNKGVGTGAKSLNGVLQMLKGLTGK